VSAPENPTPQKGSSFPKILLILGLGLLLLAEGFFGYRLHELSEKQEQLKTDYSAMNNISLGLFSLDQWHDKIEDIVNRQVKNLDITPAQKKQLQKEIEQVILALINKAEAMVTKPEKKSIRGKLVKFAVKNFVDVDTFKKQAPILAREMIAKFDNPRAKKQLGVLAMAKLAEVEETDQIDSILTANALAINKVYKKYNVSSIQQLNNKVKEELDKVTKQTYTYSTAMLICIVVVLSLWWILRKQKPLHSTLFIMSLLFAFILLGVGLTASMIEVDARIGSLDFVLLGEHITFRDQVLFFQSKSILDVVLVLLGGSGAESILVGVLILVFSILFPIMKLSSTGVHLLGRKSLAENKFIKYFAFQSGKWSMADVIVIAILMAYIGLNGLLESQLSKLNVPASSLALISTHNTALQPGFIIFIAFVLFGLTLSTILKFISPHDSH